MNVIIIQGFGSKWLFYWFLYEEVCFYKKPENVLN